MAQADGSFAFSGRLAVRQEEKNYHVSLHWQHSPQADEILITGPLGPGLAELTRDASGARLKSGKNEERRAANWAELAHDIFGAPLPVEELPGWLQGRAPTATRDIQGRPKSLQLPDWRVDWLEYADESKDALPSLLELRGAGIEVRIRIEEWETPGVQP